MATRFQKRRDTAANWTAVNPVLAQGEEGLELDTDKEKVGNGIANWNSLPYKTLGITASSIGAATAAQGAKADTAVQPPGLTKAAIGLGNVDNTSDANKPISTATAAALAGKADTNSVTAAVAAHAAAADPHPGYTLETDSRLSDPRTPTAHKSTHATGGTDALIPADIGAATAAQGAKADSAVQPAGLTRAAVGLGNVDNTSDAAKPVSTATATALAGKVATTDSRLSDARTPTAHNQAWSTITGTPTTLSGYGITDAFNPAAPGAIGGTTPGAGSFTSLTATLGFTLPSGAPGSPETRNLYSVADTLRYRDSANAERLLLNATDNLANLVNTATARTNIGAIGTVTTGITGAAQITNIISISQVNYDAIPIKNAQTLYVISG